MVDEKINNENQETDNVSSFGYATFFSTITKGFFLGIGTYMMFEISKVDTYISVIIGALTSIITIAILYFIKRHSESKDIIDLNKSLFGNVIGTILNIILCIALLVLIILILQNITQFVKILYMPDTQINYIRILFLIPIAYAANKSIGIIGRISQIVFFVNFVMLFISLIGLIPKINMDNLLPVLKDGVNPTLRSGFIYFILYSFPLLLLTIIPNYKIRSSKHSKLKVVIIFLYVTFVMFTRIIMSILVLGQEVIDVYRFPEYMVLKMSTLFEIIERMEDTLAMQYHSDVLMFCIFAMYFIMTFIRKKIKNQKAIKTIPYVISIFIFIILNILFKESILAYKFTEKYIIPIIIVGIFAPMIITLIGTIVRALKIKMINLKSAT